MKFYVFYITSDERGEIGHLAELEAKDYKEAIERTKSDLFRKHFGCRRLIGAPRGYAAHGRNIDGKYEGELMSFVILKGAIFFEMTEKEIEELELNYIERIEKDLKINLKVVK